jgi:hypothetical protein
MILAQKWHFFGVLWGVLGVFWRASLQKFGIFGVLF